MSPREHNRLVGIFLMAHGALQAVVMVFICIIYLVMGSAIFVSARGSEGQMVGVIFIAAIAFVAVFSLIFILPQIIGGYKLWKEKPSARGWGIAASIISLLSFPLGTAAGVYGLWFLFGDLGKQFYLGGRPQNQFPANFPPPGNWQ